MTKLRGLIGFERHGRLRQAFEEYGFEMWSCDLQPTTDKRNPRHLQADIREIDMTRFDFAVFHPPCTHLATSGARHFPAKRADGRQQEAIELFLWCTQWDFPWAIENPVGIMSSLYRPPDQIVQPFYFGDALQKRTCLWLHKFPKLAHYTQPTLFELPVHTDPGEFKEWTNADGTTGRMHKMLYEAKKGDNDHGEIRSVTPANMARAMGAQWSEFLLSRKRA